jgi:gamma-glutamyltranspeptidase/glutathione hydrolase
MPLQDLVSPRLRPHALYRSDLNRRVTTILSLTVLLLSSVELRHLLGASKAPIRAKHGMVASAERLASQIGIDTLKKGGNAVDAAVAVGFALAVTHPSAGNLGGGGFMMIRFANGDTACIDYRETAPAAAGRDVYLDASGQIVSKASTQGYRASGVPGTPAGLCLAQKKYGRLSLKQVIQPSIDLAEQGFLVSDHLSDSLKGSAPLLELFPESRRVYLNS